MIGGEALSVEHVRRGKARLEGTRLINGYGPTEGTTFSCCYEIGKVEEEERSIAIGKAIENTQLYILDRKGEVVGIGVIGEMYIGGDGLARGYMKRGEMTAERFVPDEWSEEGGGRLYRTGDLVRRREGGEIEFVGRRDEQVKVRGYRIEMGEIETVMREEEGVREAVVICREEERGEKRLVGYVVWEEGREGEIEEIRERLREKLPDYMVPREIVEIERVPLTGNGKVDKGRLPDGRKERKERGSDWKEAQSAEEEILRGIYEEVLRIEGVGIEEDFFEIGGHSLLATQVTSRIRESLGVEVALREVFEEPTVRGLAGRIEERRREGGWRKEEEIKKAKREEEMPLSFAQQRLWFIDQLMPDNPAYNIFKALRLSGPLNLDALLLSFDLIVSRHESLRTSFPSFAGRPSQLISPSLSFSLPLVDLSLLPEILREHEAIRIASQAAHLPFDLGLAPAWRASILRLDPNEHILLLTLHHIISDGWSIAVLLSELTTLYDAFSTGQPSPLSPLPIQYADYALWQRRLLEGERLETELEYWKRRLEGAPEGLELPTDRPRPAVQTNRGRIKEFGLSQELSVRLKEFSRTEGVTLFMTLLGGLEAMLHRYSGQDDIVVSTGVANRNRSETEKLIGCLINILLIRGRFDREKTVREMMREVREEVLGAYEHQEMPFEMLVEKMEPERDLSRHPMYQVMMVMLNLPPMEVGEMEGIKVRGMEVENRTSQSDLVIHVWEQGGKMRGTVQYNSDLFEERTVGRMMRSYEEVLRSMVEDPEVRVSKMRIMSEQEEREIVEEWNETREEMEREKTLVELFEEQAERRREAIAVIEGEREISYGEIEERANKVGNYLRKRGVKREERVGLMVERGIEMVIGMLGILKAGGGYVPMDPEYPEERLRYQMEETGAKVVMTQGRMMGEGKIGEKVMRGRRIVKIDEEWEEIERESGERPERGIGEDNLAYVIYTSGSTGRPKGVAINHRGVVNNLVDLNTRYRLGPADRVLAISTMSFDMCVYEVFATLGAGAAMVLLAGKGWRDVSYWAEQVKKHRVTVWNSAPQLLEMYVEYVENHIEKRPDGLRLVLLGGDWVPVTLPDRVKAIAGDLQVITMGGATEASIHSIIYPVDETDLQWKSIPYGKPMANQKAYVLDRWAQAVPVGVAGELHLGGEGLGRGYYNRPELTAERFIPNPYGREGGERIYKTGDLAKYKEDGTIELQGRMDFQVKIRGHRIELGEIESVFRQHPGVQDVTVMVCEYTPGDKRLVAYVAPDPKRASHIPELLREDERPLSDQLQEDLSDGLEIANIDKTAFVNELLEEARKRLPGYMVPADIVLLDRLPLSPNGKVNRRELPAPSQTRSGVMEDFVAPSTPLEEVLALIWSDVLALEQVGVGDNFFKLGGHSLLATRVITRIEEVLPLELPVRTLFESQTIAKLAREIEGKGRDLGLDVTKIAQMFIQLNGLSDDEVQTMLAEKGSQLV